MSQYFGPPLPLEIETEGNTYWGGFFQSNVTNITPSGKKLFRGRILPGYDWSMSPADTSFKKSWAPYRVVGNVDPDTEQPTFSAFFAKVQCYTWFGPRRLKFLSPETRKHILSDSTDYADPVKDIRSYIYKSQDPKLMAMLKRPQDGNRESRAIVPHATTRCLFNMWGNEISERDYKNIIVDVSYTAVEDLLQKLSEWRPPHERILDTNWENYLFGDITDPQTGVLCDVVPIPADPQPFNGFKLAEGSHKTLKGVQQLSVTEDVLENRYNLWSEDVLKIYSYQEILDQLIEDCDIPYDIIQRACGNKGDVSKKTTKQRSNNILNKLDSPSEYTPPTTTFAPKPPSPVSAPPPPNPPSTLEMFWVYDKTTRNTSKMDRHEAQRLIDSVGIDQVQIMPEDKTSGWSNPSLFKFISKAQVISLDDAPSAPDDDIPAAYVPQASVSSGNASDDKDVRARYEELEAKAKGSETLDVGELMEFVELKIKLGIE